MTTYDGRPPSGGVTGRSERQDEAQPRTSVETGTDNRPPLVRFQRLLLLADHYGKVTHMQARVAQLAAWDSNGLTGTGVVVNAEQIGAELGISSRQVWRHFHAMRDAGYFEQTHEAKRGRKARWRCVEPSLDLLGVTLPSVEVSSQPPQDGVTVARDNVSSQLSGAQQWDDTFGGDGMTPAHGEMSQSCTTDLQIRVPLGAQLQDARAAGVDDETRTLAKLTAWAKVDDPPESWRQLVRQLLILDCEPDDVVQQVEKLGDSVPIPRRSARVPGLLKKVRKPWPAPAGSAKPQ